MKKLYIKPKVELDILDVDIKFLSGSGDPEELGDPDDWAGARQRGEYYRNSSSNRNGKQQGGHWGSLW